MKLPCLLILTILGLPVTHTAQAHEPLNHSSAPETLSGQADTDFAQLMITHHAMALEMAHTLLSSADASVEARSLAHRIVAWQEAEIGQMQQWLRRRGTRGAGTSAASQEHVSIMEDMHRDMAHAAVKNMPAEQRFAHSMIPHHRAAVAMAAVELKYGSDPEMRALAQEIIRSQQAELRLMEGWAFPR